MTEQPSTPSPSGEVTALLARIEEGDSCARDDLLGLVYAELRSIAGGLMRHERPEHTLQPTALVHEAAMRLFDGDAIGAVKGRGYLFAAMTRAMRRILVDHARARAAIRRGGDHQRVPLDWVVDAVEQTGRVDLVALDEAIVRLGELNQRQSEVVTMRFFGGFDMAEIAGALGVSLSTVEKDWRLARAWLKTQLTE
ncbi:MAG: ECF-type sigma factor [Pirellulales bacterium]